MNTRGRDACRDAFTLMDLLVALVVLSILTMLSTVAMGRGHSLTGSTVCLENMRRLGMAWLFYSDEQQQRLPGNYQGGSAMSPTPGMGGWAMGWLDWTLSSANTNTTLLVSEQYSVLAPYLDADPSLFLCPADEYVTAQQASRGWLTRSRSYSMNCFMGPGNAETGPLDLNYVRYKKLTELRSLSPQEAFVFTEEHPDSINDPMIYVSMVQPRWVDLPASLHGGAAWFAFADGHAELKDWERSTTRLPVRMSVFSMPNVPADDPDLGWLRARSSERSF